MRSLFCAKILCCSFLFGLPGLVLNAQKTVQSGQKDTAWILGARVFEADETLSEAASALPRFILEKLPIPSLRQVSADELYEREKAALFTERQELYKKLKDKTAERDALVLTIKSAKKLNAALIPKDKELDAVRNLLNLNNIKTQSISPSLFLPVQEQMLLWNNDPALLYTDSAVKDLRGLITGAIVRRDSYIQVKAVLNLYPGGLIAAEISETEAVNRIEELAEKIALRLYTALANKPPIKLVFYIKPSMAAEKAQIRIDGQVFQNTDGIPSGIHRIQIEAGGYKTASINYNFADSADLAAYKIDVRLQEDIKIPIKINVPLGLSLYLNGIYDDGSDIQINGFPVLGEFVNSMGLSTWFVLRDKNQKQKELEKLPQEFSPVPAKVNHADRIEKSRQRMYTSYAILILSLPLSFITYGKYLDEYNAAAMGNAAEATVRNWNIARYTALGISGGLAVNFIVQLGLYLYSVNSVLPQEIKPAK